MTDLVLINPGGAHATYQGLAANLAAIEPPLWCRLIAGYARDWGIDVQIIDAAALGLSAEEVGAVAADFQPYLTVVCAYGHQPSASTQTMPAAYAIPPHIEFGHTAIVGGHVSALPEKTWLEGGFDFAIVGEGQETIVKLIEWLRDGEVSETVPDIPGVAHGYTDFGLVKVNAAPPLVKDLDKELHGDTWDLLPMGLYRAHNWQGFGGWPRSPYASIYTTLGCPYRCEFCCINAPFGGNFYRKRDPQMVADEIVRLHGDYGVRTLKITDEMFVLNRAHVLGVSKFLKDSGIAGDINIWAYARIDTMTDEMLSEMRAAGIRWLGIGIESGSEHVRDGAAKPFMQEDIIKAIEQVKAHDINVAANYIYGLPDDTHETMQQTLSLSMELRTEWSNHYSAMAYPGSRLYTQALQRHWRLPDTWAGYSQHSYECTPLPTATLSSEQVLAFRDKAFTEYFTNPAYLHMVAKKFGTDTVREIEAMTAIKLKRKILGE